MVRANRTDHASNSITISESVWKTLKNEGGNTLSPSIAVAAMIKTEALAAWGQHAYVGQEVEKLFREQKATSSHGALREQLAFQNGLSMGMRIC